MIVDKLSNAPIYYGLGERFKAGFEYLQSTDFSSMEKGEYPVSGKEIYLVLAHSQPRERSTAQFEAHREYADLQYVIKGSDLMGYAPLDQVQVTQEYDPETDALLASGSDDFLRTSPGMFYLFGPQDAHMPAVKGEDSDDATIKAVLKVLID